MRRGFTMVEVLIVIGVLVVLSGISFTVYKFFPIQNEVEIAKTTIAQAARRAQVLARAQKNDDSWGIKIETGKVTIFKGDIFSGRDNSYDEIMEMDSDVVISGDDEVVFTKFTGEPTGTATINLSLANQNRTININAKGVVSY